MRYVALTPHPSLSLSPYTSSPQSLYRATVFVAATISKVISWPSLNKKATHNGAQARKHPQHSS